MAMCKFSDDSPGGKGGPVTNSAGEKSMSSKGIDISVLKVKGKNLGQKSSSINESFTNFENVVCAI